MSTRMKKYKKDLCFLGRCSHKQRVNYLKSVKPDVINAIGDVAKTILTGNLPIKVAQRKKLRARLATLKELATKQRSIKRKKTILSSQKGGSILKVLWNVIKEFILSYG